MSETPYFWIFILLLPMVAFLYASIVHGGASGYLALMVLFSFSPETIRPIALLISLLVSATAFIITTKCHILIENCFYILV